MASRFRQRSVLPELMDDFSSHGQIMDQTLRELDVINRWLGGYRVTLSALACLNLGKLPGELHLADFGCGGGHMLSQIRQWAVRRKLKVNLSGFDANPHILENAARNFREINFRHTNVLSGDISGNPFNVINCTLLLHHFRDSELILFLKKIRPMATSGIIINDLHRHWFAYYSIKFLTQIFSRSPMVQNDAPVSVLRAFTRHELIGLLRSAGISQYRLRWKWAFRWQLIIFPEVKQSR